MSLRLERSGRESRFSDLVGMGRASREAAKAAKRDGRWADADTQRNQGRKVGVACGSGNLRIGAMRPQRWLTQRRKDAKGEERMPLAGCLGVFAS